MTKASKWQALVVAASLAGRLARDAQPMTSGWAPGELSWKVVAVSEDTMSLKTQVPDVTVQISKETALIVARWILDTFAARGDG